MKFLKSKNKIYENWLNPILNGGCNNNIMPPGSFNPVTGIESSSPGAIKDPCNDMIEKPFWLDNTDPTLVRNGDILSIGRFYINGVPLSQWSTLGGSYVAFQTQQTMNNWYYTDYIMKKVFPNGIKAYLASNDVLEYNIKELIILKMVPLSTGIGLNIYFKFKLNDNDIWAKLENVGVNPKPKFVCDTLDKLKHEDRIKITGKVNNIIFDWFKAKTGIYNCIAKEVLVYTELGQLKKISEGETVEVLHSDENRIKIIQNGTTYLIKKPTYFWWNWYFQKK